MCRLKLYSSIFSISCLVFTFAVSAHADGDPADLIQTDFMAEETVGVTNSAGNLLPDEQVAPPEEAVATITADGDFLLPTYLLPGETATVERTTTVEKVFEKRPPQMATMAVPVAQETVVSQKTTTTTTTPDDLQILAQPTESVTPPAIQAPASQSAQTSSIEPTEPETEPKEVAAPKKLLIPLAPVPKVALPEPDLPAKERVIVPFEYADQMAESLKSGEPVPFKMPHEIRITFYPRASAFSGQTLKWIRAFALAALQDPRLIVEIRASCAEAALQDARLKLVKGALAGVGLSSHQIIVNYTNRPVDTMLLRAVPRPEPAETVLTKKDIKLPKSMSRVKKW